MRAFLALAVLAASGCTAVKATVNLVAADQAVARAQDHRAPELAVYEYTMAIRYLEKAREEAGYADYKVAESLARQAADWADQSIIVIERGGRNLDLEDVGADMTDEPPDPDEPSDLDEPSEAPAAPTPTPAPPPAPPPAPEPSEEPSGWDLPEGGQ